MAVISLFILFSVSGAVLRRWVRDAARAVILAVCLTSAGTAADEPPAQDSRTTAEVRSLIEQKRHREALEYIENTLNAAGQSATTRLGSAEALSQFKHMDPAALQALIKADPSNPTYRKKLAKVLYDLGRTEEAVAEWKQLADRRPPDPEAMLQLGWAYLKLKKINDADKLTTVLMRLDPNNLAFLKLAANVSLEKGGFRAAAEYAERSLKIEPDNKDSALILAKAAMRLGNHKKAIGILEELVRKFPDNPNVRYDIADVLISAGRPEEALPVLNVLVKADPSNTVYRKRRAQVLYDMGRIEEATAERRLLALETPTNTEVQMQLGWSYMATQKFDEAYRIAEQLVQVDPQNATFLRFMAAVEVERKNYESAVRWAHKALRILPRNRDISIVLARALTNLRREKEALNVLTNLINTGNDNASVWMHMGYILSHLGRYEESYRYFDKLHKSEPENPDWRRLRANAVYQLGRYDEAVKEWRDLAGQKPPDSRSIRQLADDAFFRKDWREFISWIEKLGEVEVVDAFHWSRVASAYLAMNDTGKALAAADRYIEADPSNLEGYLFKAEVLEGLQDWEDAKRINEFVLSRNPNNRRAWDALARIASEQRDYVEAIRIQRVIRKKYLVAYPYPILREAGWLAEAGQSDEAMKILQKFSKERPTTIVSLLYHGISPVERSDSISIEAFRAHMHALKKAGFTAITVSELEPYYKKGKPLPKKPLLITFDDARIDSFRHADPILKEVGFKATMFVHFSALDNFPFHVGPPELREWASNGRWEIQSHSSLGHEAIKVDAAGRQGRFLANRMWLEEEHRLETVKEFKARVDKDYRDSKNYLEKEFPGARIMAFAFPYGEYGQEGSVNIPNAMEINREAVKKYFDFCFVQGPYGHNLAESRTTELTRFEPPIGMTADQLISHIAEQEPWVQAKLMEARVWLVREQPLRALRVVRNLEKAGLRGPEILAQKGIAMDALGRPAEARRLYALASAKAPTKERYQRLLKRADNRGGPVISTEYGTFSDNSTRENSITTARVTAPVGPLQISGSYGRERYTGRLFHLPGLVDADYSGSAGSLGVRWVPFSRATINLAFGQRRLEGATSNTFNNYAAGVTLSILPQMRFLVEQHHSNIDTAEAIDAGIEQDRRGLGVEWDSAFNTTLSLNQDKYKYSDENTRSDIRFDLTRYITPWLAAGYSFWYADAAEMREAYWTPQKLKQHMAVVTLEETVGPLSGRIRYGRGYGYESVNARSVQTFLLGLDWRFSENLSLIYNTAYSRSPVYITNRINFGISLRY